MVDYLIELENSLPMLLLMMDDYDDDVHDIAAVEKKEHTSPVHRTFVNVEDDTTVVVVVDDDDVWNA